MLGYKVVTDRFPAEREQKLRSIKRFSIAEVFLYRSSLWDHSLRVHFITNQLSKIAVRCINGYCSDKAAILALVHDDAEMITGDVQLGHKLIMTSEQLQEVRKNDERAIELLAGDDDAPITLRFAGSSCYMYGSLLLHALNKDCVEAQVVSLADKIDAYCESLHEVFAGNLLALRPFVHYTQLIKEFGTKKFPVLEPLVKQAEFMLANPSMGLEPVWFRKADYEHLGKPHTRESVVKDTQITLYNFWKRLVLENLGEGGMEILTKQVEFL